MHLSTRFNGAIACVALAAVFATPSIASAAGTGDGPKTTRDVLTRTQAVRKAGDEGVTKRTLASKVIAQAIDAPFKFLWTPTHEQERSYWCAPATVQVIDDYFGTPCSQQTYANYMGTSASGTDFSRVDDALRHYTGKSYYYYGGLSKATLRPKIFDTLYVHGQPLAADLRIDASAWPNYVYDHDGHIIPIEGFDWRSSTEPIRINDVYDEAGSRAGGGSTLGHRTYTYSVIWDGVGSHPRKAVVAAP